VWILGSSLYGAQLAAALGLPYAFASHFAPALLEQALAIYRAQFRPSIHLDKPYAMLGLNVVAGETDAQARRLFTSLQQAFVNLHQGRPGLLPPPVEDVEGLQALSSGPGSPLSLAVVGGPSSIQSGLAEVFRRHQPDEIMISAQIFDEAKRMRSLEIVAEVAQAPIPA
jgi:luciferase family oxidoreductase group 1